MTFEELQCHELERMKFNAIQVCNKLTSRMDGAPVLNGFIKSQTFLPKSELFFNNEEYLKIFIIATPANKLLIPAYNYFQCYKFY